MYLFLSSNEHEHAVEVVVTWEVIDGLLGVPLLLALHEETSLSIVVEFQEGSHQTEPIRAPLHLIESHFWLAFSQILLELTEVHSVKLNELFQLLRQYEHVEYRESQDVCIVAFLLQSTEGLANRSVFQLQVG